MKKLTIIIRNHWQSIEIQFPLFIAKMIVLVIVVFGAFELSIWFGVFVLLIALGFTIKLIKPVVKKIYDFLY